MTTEKMKGAGIQEIMPSAKDVQKELAKTKSMDDFSEGRDLCPVVRRHDRDDAGCGTE